MFKNKKVISALISAAILITPISNNIALAGQSTELVGDINRDNIIDNMDLRYVETMATVKTSDPSYSNWEPYMSKADFNGDNIVDSTDISLMNQFLNGQISSFPIENKDTDVSTDTDDLNKELVGDINRDNVIDNMDLRYVETMASVKTSDPSYSNWEPYMPSADFNGDNIVDSTDISLMNQFLNGQISSFPIENKDTDVSTDTDDNTNTDDLNQELVGDINRDNIVDDMDLRYVETMASVKTSDPSYSNWEPYMSSADFNGDNLVDSADISLMNQFLNGQISSFPIENKDTDVSTDTDGNTNTDGSDIEYVIPTCAYTMDEVENIVLQIAKNQDTSLHKLTYFGDTSNLEEEMYSATRNIFLKNGYDSGNIYDFGLYQTQEDKKTIININLTYHTTREEEEELDVLIKNVLDKIITPDMNDFEKEKAIHDYICDNIKYDYSFSQNNASAYVALTTNKTVCYGFTALNARMLDAVGIENLFVAGKDHAWNLVKVDGNWYHVDCTWDSTATGFSDKYFNTTDDEMRPHHTWGTGYSLKPVDYPKAFTPYYGK